MKKFMGEDFLLSNPTSNALFENYAKNTPIIDYHCHLVPAEIAENKQFSNITEAWLYADHYKWRAIRACGFEEKYVTGGKTCRTMTDFSLGQRLCRALSEIRCIIGLTSNFRDFSAFMSRCPKTTRKKRGNIATRVLLPEIWVQKI